MRFLLALQFLTRVPLRINGVVEEKDLAAAMAYFPAIGLFIGALAAGIHYLLAIVFTPPVCAFFAIAFLVAITGNMHTDGLMDAADGLFSGKPRERMLEIMKDSRVGSHGVTAGILVLLAKFVLLWQLPGEAKLQALIIAPSLGRWSQVYSAMAHPYARPEGGTGGFTDLVGKRELLIASVTALAAVIISLWAKGLLLAGVILTATIIIGRYVSGKIGGVTGDTLGAVSECIEVLSLATILFIFNF